MNAEEITTDMELAMAGFIYAGRLCEIPGHEDEREELFIARRDDKRYIFRDEGDEHCSYVRPY